MSDIPYMDLDDFMNEGWLQEVNRLFFHPRGLALCVNVDDDGHVTDIAGVWDDRGDPEGWYFSTTQKLAGFSLEKTVIPAKEAQKRARAREKMFGRPTIVQPLEWSSEVLETPEDDKLNA